jgi:hypothetical protein
MITKNKKSKIKRNKTNNRFNLSKQNKIKTIKCNNFEKKLKGKHRNSLDILGEGAYGIAFMGCLDKLCSKSIGVKFLVLKTKYNNDTRHPGQVEVIMGKRLSQLHYDNITPHINLVYKGFMCHIDKIKKTKTLRNTEWYLTKLKNNKFGTDCYHEVMVILNEKADSDFKKYSETRLASNNKLTEQEHIIALFTFCYTISSAQYHIPGFRHNDIKPNNLLVTINNNNNINNNEYNCYKIFGNHFYIPVTKFTLKLHDFDFCNSDEYPNSKILGYDNFFGTIGTTPFNNPVYDLHEYINFYFRDLESSIVDTPTWNLLKKLIPSNTFGKDNTYTNRYKLTNFKVNQNNNKLDDEQFYNYIPKTMKTPSELLLKSKLFKKFRNKPEGAIIIKTYDSQIPSIKNNPDILYRTDMFNTILKT